MRINLLLVGATVFALSTMGCTNTGTKTETKEPTETADTAVEDALQDTVSVVNPTADVSFKDGAGKQLKLSELKGKVVFVNFWATWCPPCIEELPSIAKLSKHFANNEDIAFLLVDVDGEYDQSADFLKTRNIKLANYIPDSVIPSSFLENAIPSTVIIDKKGKLVQRFQGARDYDNPDMIKAIESLVQEN
ncbi:TlpA family protein disulfide reductase [Sphingobacterium sp. Mn56C]|uniref:TlpA family protein disulfide reductase n=1 Tax=Sphingobacterium sp. Mn56C TaxID=3395261 RepID=UPI003BE89A1F